MNTQKTSLSEIIRRLPARGFVFKTSKSFFTEIQINQKRWGQIYRGEKSPTLEELERIASYFDVNITDLISNNRSTASA